MPIAPKHLEAARIAHVQAQLDAQLHPLLDAIDERMKTTEDYNPQHGWTRITVRLKPKEYEALKDYQLRRALVAAYRRCGWSSVEMDHHHRFEDEPAGPALEFGGCPGGGSVD